MNCCWLFRINSISLIKSINFNELSSKKSKAEKILPLGLTDGAIVKKDINKDQSIRLDDVELKLPDDVVKARQY